MYSPSLFAQDDCVERFDREGIYLRSEFWRGTVFVKNGVARSVGFAYKKLRPEFEMTPRAMPMFKKAQRNAKISFVVGIAGLVGTTAGVLLALQSVDDQGYLVNEQRYKNGVNLILASTVLSAAINVPLQIRSRQQMDDAIWLRNREILGR